MFNLAKYSSRIRLRRFSTAIRRHVEDEGDWFYASEWWGDGSSASGTTVFREVSDKGNGLVSVRAHPCSKPEKCYWGSAKDWLERRYSEINPDCGQNGTFRICGYQWRTLHFNDHTRQSTVKVMATFRESDPDTMYIMQQPYCLAIPYVKSMVSTGLATISSCNYDLKSAVFGEKSMNILCIGHGGGSIPLFLASKIRGALVHTVEIDPVVISASTQAMGFPSFSIMSPSRKRAYPTPDPIQQVLWKGTHERLHLYESDAEKFILESSNTYDIIFLDAYDGEDIFPRKLWDPDSPFIKALGERLHPEHGTVVVNLHADVDIDINDSSFPHVLPMGKYVSRVCRAYKDTVLGNSNTCNSLAYTVSVPWLCNASLVVCRGFPKPDGFLGRDTVLDRLLVKSLEVENLVDLPFSCFRYIKRGFIPIV